MNWGFAEFPITGCGNLFKRDSVLESRTKSGIPGQTVVTQDHYLIQEMVKGEMPLLKLFLN